MTLPKKVTNPDKKEFLTYITVGIQLVISVAGLGYLGYLGDKSLDFYFPVFTLLGIITGLTGNIYYLLRDLNKKK